MRETPFGSVSVLLLVNLSEYNAATKTRLQQGLDIWLQFRPGACLGSAFVLLRCDAIDTRRVRLRLYRRLFGIAFDTRFV